MLSNFLKASSHQCLALATISRIMLQNITQHLQRRIHVKCYKVARWCGQALRVTCILR